MRRRGAPQRLHTAELFALRRRTHVGLRHLGQPRGAAVTAVLQIELEAAGRTQAEDRRRVEGQHQRFLDVRRLHEQLADEGLHGHGTFVPVRLRDEDRGRVVAIAAAEKVEAREGDGVLVVGVGLDDLQHLGDDLVGAFQRCAIGQDHRGDVVALVFIRHQRPRRDAPQADGECHHADEEHDADAGTAHHEADTVDIACGDARETAVEPGEEAPRLAMPFAQDEHAQTGRERERDDARDHHGDGDGGGELPVELARQAAEESDGHEHRTQHEHDGDHRAGHFLHRLDGGFARLKVLLAHDALDVLQHDDGVVDNDADGQHHAEQGQRVDRIAEQQEPGERARQRHRNGHQRNQGGAPALQEEKDHGDDEQHGFEQGLHDLFDRHLDEARGVVGHRVGHARREARGDRRHGAVDLGGDIERVRAGLQEDAHQRGRLAVDAADEVVVLGTELDARHVLQAQRAAVGLGAQQDVFELPHFAQAALRGDGVDHLLRATRGRLPHFAGGELRVLLVDGARDVARGELELRQPIGPQPDAHGPVLGTEDLHIGRAGHALQAVEHVQRDVVADRQVVAAAIGREEGLHLQKRRRALLHRHALAAHFLRQLGLGLLDAVVDGLRGRVDIGADVEGHLNRYHAVGRGGGAHVEHVLDAVDGVFQRRSNRLLDDLGAGTGVDRRDADNGRRDLGVLRDGQGARRSQARDDDEQREHSREDRSVDEEAGEHARLPTSRPVQRRPALRLRALSPLAPKLRRLEWAHQGRRCAPCHRRSARRHWPGLW